MHLARSDRTSYYLSGSYFDQQGIVIGSRYRRGAGRTNLDFTATNKLTVRTSLGLSREDNQRIEGDGSLDGVVTNALGMQPMRPVYRDDGSTYSRALSSRALDAIFAGTRQPNVISPRRR
jgi:hypothetical protein